MSWMKADTSKLSDRLVKEICEFWLILEATRPTLWCTSHVLFESEISCKNWSRSWVGIPHQQLRCLSHWYASFIDLEKSFQNHRHNPSEVNIPKRYGTRTEPIWAIGPIYGTILGKLLTAFRVSVLEGARSPEKLNFELPNGDDAVGVWKWRDSGEGAQDTHLDIGTRYS